MHFMEFLRSTQPTSADLGLLGVLKLDKIDEKLDGLDSRGIYCGLLSPKLFLIWTWHFGLINGQC